MNIEKAIWYIKTQLLKFQYGHVGRHSYIGKALFIQRKKKLFIGNNVRIYPGMRAELTEESAEICIQDNVSIGQNFHVVSYRGKLIIGKDTTISGNVFITNVNHDYRKIGIHVLEQDMLEAPTAIGENCFIGYGAVIMPGTILGKQCIVGANAVVSGQFPDYSVIVGVPGRVVKTFDMTKGEWVRF